MYVENLLERADISGQFRPDMLHMSDKLKVPLISLAAGQEIPPHGGEEGVFTVLKGEGVARAGEEEFEVSEGSFWNVEEGQVRGLRAEKDLVVVVAASLA